MGLNRLWQMSLLAIKSDILESITNIGGPWGRGMGGTGHVPSPQILLAPLGGGGMPPKIFTGYIMIWKVYLKRISK